MPIMMLISKAMCENLHACTAMQRQQPSIPVYCTGAQYIMLMLGTYTYMLFDTRSGAKRVAPLPACPTTPTTTRLGVAAVQHNIQPTASSGRQLMLRAARPSQRSHA